MTGTLSAGLRQQLYGLLIALVAAVVLVGATAPPALAKGPSLEQFSSQNWTCFVPPTRPDLVVCYNAGQGRPFPGNPEPPPSYTVVRFSSSSGDFLGTGHLRRADLYANQPCPPGDEPYVLLAPLGYYECVHT
jgi:hypothetical protein